MYDDDYLAHYGILGMKWGVRKDRGSVSLDPLIIFKPEGSLSKVESLKLTTEDIKNYNKQVVNTNFRKARKTFNEAHK